MASKHSSWPDPEPERPKKRARTNRHHVDLASGQRYALCGPGLQDDEFDIADCSDAMAYLDSVRLEASSLTQVLAVKKHGPQAPDGEETISHEIYSSGVGDFRGYFKDGAYIAAPSSSVDGDSGRDDSEDECTREARIREAYYQSVLARFTSLRAVLHTKPPPGAVRALPRHSSPHVGSFGVRSGTFIVWSDRLRNTDPHPVQLAAMTKEGVLRVLRVLLWGKHLRRGRAVSERTARWVWALLARLPDRSVLDHVEVGWVRDLGRRAVLLATEMTDMAVLREEVAEGGGDLGIHDDVDGSSEGDEDMMAELEADGYDGDGGESGAGDEAPNDAAPLVTTADAAGLLGAASDGAKTKGDADAASASGKSMDLSDGEIDETEPTAEAPTADAIENETGRRDGDHATSASIEEAKARVLRLIQQRGSRPGPGADESEGDEPTAAEPAPEPTPEPAPEHVNTHATLAMILTVAGELYGQRDLLEFRHPFPMCNGT